MLPLLTVLLSAILYAESNACPPLCPMYSECQTFSWGSKCVCQYNMTEEYRNNTAELVGCVKPPNFCFQTSDCPYDKAICDSYRCSCPDNLYAIFDSSALLTDCSYNKRCSDDGDCPRAYTQCAENGFCGCKYVLDSETSNPTACKEPNRCRTTKDCYASNSHCNIGNNSCECKENFRGRFGMDGNLETCYGDYCVNEPDCIIPNSFCDKQANQCICKTGYRGIHEFYGVLKECASAADNTILLVGCVVGGVMVAIIVIGAIGIAIFVRRLKARQAALKRNNVKYEKGFHEVPLT